MLNEKQVRPLLMALAAVVVDAVVAEGVDKMVRAKALAVVCTSLQGM